MVRDLPTAIFAVSDEVAMGVLFAARELGISSTRGSVRHRRRRPRFRLPVRPDDDQPARAGPGPNRCPAVAGAGRIRIGPLALDGRGELEPDRARHHRSARRRRSPSG